MVVSGCVAFEAERSLPRVVARGGAARWRGETDEGEGEVDEVLVSDERGCSLSSGGAVTVIVAMPPRCSSCSCSAFSSQSTVSLSVVVCEVISLDCNVSDYAITS